MTDKEVIQIAINALWKSFNVEATRGDLLKAINILEAALAQPEMDAVLAEREACAKVCEETYTGEEASNDYPTPEMCAAAIRARGNK